MIGPDTIRIHPLNRRMRRTARHREALGPPTGWKLLGSQMASAEFGYATTTEWTHRPTGIWLREHSGQVVSVQANLSRLLTGAGHNGHIVKSQAETDEAMANLWRLLDQISDGPHDCEITTLEIGGVVEEPLSTFESLLRHRNLPGARKAPAIRPGESVTFGATRRPRCRVIFYDKGRELGIGPGRWTRVEVRLVGERLLKEFGVDRLTRIEFDRLAPIFYRIVHSLDPDGSATAHDLDGSMVSLLALLLDCEECVKDGEHLVDIWKRSKNPQHARRMIRRAESINVTAGAVTLRDLLPEDPPRPYVDLPPGAVPEVVAHEWPLKDLSGRRAEPPSAASARRERRHTATDPDAEQREAPEAGRQAGPDQVAVSRPRATRRREPMLFTSRNQPDNERTDTDDTRRQRQHQRR